MAEDTRPVVVSFDGSTQSATALIVVGSRGLGSVKAWLLGSTTRRLLHESHRPVLVVRNGCD